MLQVWLAVTTEVGIEKVAELDPNGTETAAGGCAAVLSLDIPIFAPPGAAVPVSATVADTFFPPSTLAGATDNVDSCSALAGSISSAAVWLAPAARPVMVAVWTAVTGNVETVTWRDAFPAGTVTKKGGCAAALLLLNDTDKPIDRATPLRETVRVALFPPFT
jgi:hypothetical protein